MSTWVIWLIVAGVLLVLELLSGTVAALCIAVGCLLSVIPALLDLSIVWQIIAFVIGATLSFIFIRPTVKRLYAGKHKEAYLTNMDALIGRTGKVTKEITNNFDDGGRVQIDGDNWLAYTTSLECPIHHGEQVIVEAYNSLVLKVRPANK